MHEGLYAVRFHNEGEFVKKQTKKKPYCPVQQSTVKNLAQI